MEQQHRSALAEAVDGNLRPVERYDAVRMHVAHMLSAATAQAALVQPALFLDEVGRAIAGPATGVTPSGSVAAAQLR